MKSRNSVSSKLNETTVTVYNKDTHTYPISCKIALQLLYEFIILTLYNVNNVRNNNNFTKQHWENAVN